MSIRGRLWFIPHNSMNAPHLTFFVELPSDQLAELFALPDIVEFLVHTKSSVAMGLMDLTPERAAVVRRLEAAGVAVTAWLLLAVADGYWLNADNADRARTRYRETIEWADREELRLHRVGLDIEFPRADAELLQRQPRRGLLTLLRRRRSAAQVHTAERAYADLVADIRAAGRSVETYHFPFILDERAVRSTLLRRTLGLVDVAADAEVFMLYASYIGRAGARVYFPEVRHIALGVTGGGVNAGDPEEVKRVLRWPRLEEDLLAAAATTQEIYVFSLEGCVEQHMLEQLRCIDWTRARDDLAASQRRSAGRRRVFMQWVLRAEPLFDLVFPARSTPTR